MKLNSQHQEAIQALILYRGLSSRANAKVAKLVGVVPRTVIMWRKDKDFSAQLRSELRAFRSDFENVTLAHRKERVLALEAIFDKLDERQVGMKIKVLQAIRQEVGDDKQVIEVQHSGHIGVELPPRATTYDEWLEQNASMARNRVEEGTMVDEQRIRLPSVRRPSPPCAVAAARGEDSRPQADLYVMSEERKVG